MTRKQTVHLSGEAIKAIESALFSDVALANTQLRAIPAAQWSSGEVWVEKRTRGLDAMRELATYAASRDDAQQGYIRSMCEFAKGYFRERG